MAVDAANLPETDVRRLRILLQTVGTGGPANPVWEAMAHTVRDRKPDLLVQLCSAVTREQTVPRFDSCLAANDHPPQVRRLVCTDADDVEQLTMEYLKLIDDLRCELPGAVVEVDFTSGTKPMSAALVAAGVARRVPSLHYAVGPRDASGRATQTERLCSIQTGVLVADRQLIELGRLFEAGQFVAVKVEARSLHQDLGEHPLGIRAESLALLAEAYDYWDRFAWPRAFDAIAGLRKGRRATVMQSAGWDMDVLARQAAFLKSCGKQQTNERLMDLLSNANRCIENGSYDDALARLYRLTEYILQQRFITVFDVPAGRRSNPTKNIPLEQLRRLAPSAAIEAARSSWSDKVTLGLAHTMCVLAETGDPVAREMWQSYAPPDETQPEKKGPLGQRLDARNESLLAHGQTPISAEAATDLRDDLQQYLKLHLGFPARTAGAAQPPASLPPDATPQPEPSISEAIAHGEKLLVELQQTARFLKCPWVPRHG